MPNGNYTQNNFAFNTNSYESVCLATKTHKESSVEIIIDVVNYGRLSIPVVGSAFGYSQVYGKAGNGIL